MVRADRRSLNNEGRYLTVMLNIYYIQIYINIYIYIYKNIYINYTVNNRRE